MGGAASISTDLQQEARDSREDKTEEVKMTTIDRIVNSFLNEQVARRSKYLATSEPASNSTKDSINLSVKIDNNSSRRLSGEAPRRPSKLETVVNLASILKECTSSLKLHAIKHHSRQQNSYINQDTVVASFIECKATSMRGSSNNSLTSNKSASNALAIVHHEVAQPAKHTQESLRKKFNLKLPMNDEADWIQVSDDEAEEDLSPRKKKVVLTSCPPAQQSYTLTQSGTLFVAGFCEGITKNGIIDHSQKAKMPMRERLMVLCKLGQGASGIVYKAVDLIDMRIVALKMVPVFDREKRRQMVRELSALFHLLRKKKGDSQTTEISELVSALSEISSPQNSDKIAEPESVAIVPQHYIVDMYDAFSNVEDGGVALMVEYMNGGSLQEIVNSGGCQDESVLANIAFQGLVGLAFLHQCNQIHRDIKPANMLINLNGDVKISDLGILRQFDSLDGLGSEVETDDNAMHRAHTFIGTTSYMAPERIDGREYSYSSDIWSFGLTLLAIALGRHPIDSKSGFWGVLHTIRDCPAPSLPADGNWSEEFRTFLSHCLVKDPEDRLSAIELLKLPFLKKRQVDEVCVSEAFAYGEISAVVNAVYSHLSVLYDENVKKRSAVLNLLQGDEDAPLEGSKEGAAITEEGDASIMSVDDMANILLFGAGSAGARKEHRLSTLASQLHIDVDNAIALAKHAISSRRVASSSSESKVSTPKAHHHKSM